LQAERELKGKLLILRMAFLESADNHKIVGNIVKNSISSIIPVLKAILVIKKKEIPKSNHELIQNLGNILKINMNSIHKAFGYKSKKFDLKGPELIDFFEEYINTVDNLSETVDKF